jgi:predicted transcriptional regulator
LEAQQSLGSALEQLEDWQISGAPVKDPSGQWIGVLTLTSLNVAVLLHGSTLAQSVEDSMTPVVLGYAPDTRLDEVILSLVENRIHRVFSQKSDGQLEGVLTTLDLLEAVLANSRCQSSSYSVVAHEWRRRCENFLAQPIGRLSRPDLKYVTPSQSLLDFLKLSQEYTFSGAPVVDPQTGDLVGMLSQCDLARRLCNGPGDVGMAKVADLMSPFSFRLDCQESLLHATHLLLRQRIHRVVVSDGLKPVGVLSVLDILRGLLEVGED